MRRVAVVAAGQTHHVRKRADASQPEMVYEAVSRALEGVSLKPQDIDAVIFSTMSLFSGRVFIDLWCAEAATAFLKPCLKATTAGTSGTSAVIAGFYQVASGFFDIVLVVGVEKHSEGHTQTGMALTDPLWDRPVAGGALNNFALSISQFMRSRGITERQAALVAVKARRNACKNPYAHLKMPDITVEEVLNSRMLAWPVRLLDMCPQSDGACAVVLAAEGVAERICRRPAWFKAVATAHDKPYLGDHEDRLSTMRTLRRAARRAYAQAGIEEPLRQLDVAEIYEPVSYAELAWYEALGFCAEGESGRLIEDGVTEMTGELPVNPSGGVLSTNPVGASGVIRVAEAAMQIHGTSGDHQIPNVKTALVTGYGAYTWSDVIILTAEKPR